MIIIDDGSNDGSSEVIRRFIEAVPPPSDVSVHFHARENKGAHATINEGISLARGRYIAILNSDDEYAPLRIEQCIATACRNNSRLVFTYVEPIDAQGCPLVQEHPWRKLYYDAQRQELDAAPSVGFVLLSYNIAVAAGNLFFQRDLYDLIGPFGNYRYTHGLDFIMRALELEEPILIRQPLYRYRVHDKSAVSVPSGNVDGELEQIFRCYLSSVLVKVPRNLIAPAFTNWPASMGATFGPMTRGLNRAIDSLIETRTAATCRNENEAAPRIRAARSQRAEITLISHELSRTGAPTLALEVARYLTRAGASVNIVSMVDGPLRFDFERAGIPVTVAQGVFLRKLTGVANTLSALSHHVHRQRLLRGSLRWLSLAVRASSAALTVLKLLPKIRRCLLINSFTAWPIALPVVALRPLTRTRWYIHESCDPHLLLTGRFTPRLFRKIYRRKNISFLFGSDGTRRLWASCGYDGQVRYWSGLPAATAQRRSVQGQAEPAKTLQARRMVLSVGTSGNRKGTRTLIEAFAYGCSSGVIDDDVELVIVGCLPPSVHAQTRDLLIRALQPDLHGKVRLVGVVDRTALESYYAAAMVYVQSSTMECLPLALLTAMAYRLPIVATDVDGCNEAILDGVCGLTVPPRNIPQLANAIGYMLANSAQAQLWGEVGQERFVRMFSLEATADPLIKAVFPEGVLQPQDALITVPQSSSG
jgi:glycosyltransferase involved in cell wall biosynthesis